MYSLQPFSISIFDTKQNLTSASPLNPESHPTIHRDHIHDNTPHIASFKPNVTRQQHLQQSQLAYSPSAPRSCMHPPHLYPRPSIGGKLQVETTSHKDVGVQTHMMSLYLFRSQDCVTADINEAFDNEQECGCMQVAGTCIYVKLPTRSNCTSILGGAFAIYKTLRWQWRLCASIR
jgi:hypothetical protein